MGFGDVVRRGSGAAVDAIVVVRTPTDPAAHPPAAAPATTAVPLDTVSTPNQAMLPVRAADLDHATVPPSTVVSAFNCARQRLGLPPYVVDAQLTAEATGVAARVQAGGRGPQLGEQGWTLTGTLVLDATIAPENCAISGLDIGTVPNLDRATHIGIAVVSLPEPHLVLAVVVGH
jgi:hypothetical protein